MSLWIKIFLLVVIIQGTTCRRLPGTKLGSVSGPTDDKRAHEEDRPSGKYHCKDCDSDAEPGSEVKPESSGGDQFTERSRGHVSNKEHESNVESKITRGQRSRGQSRRSRVKPFLSFGKIRIHVNNKPVESVNTKEEHSKKDAYEHTGTNVDEHSLNSQHLKEGTGHDNNMENIGLQSQHQGESISEITKVHEKKSHRTKDHKVQNAPQFKDNKLKKVDDDLKKAPEDSSSVLVVNTQNLDRKTAAEKVEPMIKKEDITDKDVASRKPLEKANNKPEGKGKRKKEQIELTKSRLNLDEELTGDTTGTVTKDIDVDKNIQKETDNVLLGKVDGRWSRPGLSQVPDALRLERRLHPTLDAPIRDIMGSLERILHHIQSSVHRTEQDYEHVFNSTRWALMVGVREKLSRLIEQNDAVYDIVMEASLLTKGIYRRAHERRHKNNSLHHAQALTTQDPRIQTVQLRPLYEKAMAEMEKAVKVKRFIAETLKQRNDLMLELAHIQSKVEDSVPTRALHDLQRRAQMTMSILQSTHNQQDGQDAVNLFGHMNGNVYLNMRMASNLTGAAAEELMYAKRQSMVSKGIATKIYKALHDHMPHRPGPGYSTLDQTRFELWHKVDIASLHASDLFDRAANIHMKLKPLMDKANEVLENYRRSPHEKRLQKTVEEIRQTNKLLISVMDNIVLELKQEHLLRDRCEFLDRSGYLVLTQLNCDQFIEVVDGSGTDTEEGSGDIDSVAVDLDTFTLNNETIKITDNTDKGVVDVEIPAKQNDTDETDNVVPTDESPDAVYEGSADIDITDMTDSSGKTQDIPDTIFIDEDLGENLVPSRNTVTGKPSVDVIINKTAPSNVEISTKSPTVSVPVDSDDEDIIKEVLKTRITTVKPKEATTKSAPVTTAEAKTETTKAVKVVTRTTATTELPTTTKTPVITTGTTAATTKKSFWQSIWSRDEPLHDWFGLAADQPIEDDFVDTELIHVDAEDMSLNELIRMKLANFSSRSEELYDEAKKIKETANEMVQTWSKVKMRFQEHENSTLQAKAFVSKLAAEQASFTAVHDRVQNVVEEVNVKSGIVTSLIDKALEKAGKKLASMQKRYQARAQGAAQSADPAHVTELKASVAKAREDLSNIRLGLRKVPPSLCKLAEMYNKSIRANISELRTKIEKAKQMAASLQVAMKLDGSSYLAIPVNQTKMEQHPLTARLDMIVKLTDKDGVVVGVETENTGSFILRMDDMTPVVITFDKGKYEIDDISTGIELEKGTWYRFILERIAKTFNFTVYDASTGDLVGETSLVFDEDNLKLVQTPPTTVFVGGLSSKYSNYGSWSGCIGSVTINGQILSLLGNDSSGRMLTPCTTEKFIYHRQDSLMLDGTGFAEYKLPQTVGQLSFVQIHFRPLSDGLVFLLSSRKLGLHARTVIEDGRLVVHVKLGHSRLMSAVVNTAVFGTDFNLKIIFSSRPSLVVNEVKTDLKPSQDQNVFRGAESDDLFVGAAPSYNRSLVGCVHSVVFDDHSLHLSNAIIKGGVIGTCRQRGCSEFTKDSTPVKKTKLSKAKEVHIAFKYGAVGPLIHYIKDKKFDVTVGVANATLDILQTVGSDEEQQESTLLQGYKAGDTVVVTMKDKDDEILISAGSAKPVLLEYESGGNKGGWAFFGGADEEKSSYSVTVGASTEYDNKLQGQIEEVIIDGRRVNLSAYRDDSGLGVCRLSAHKVNHWEKDDQQVITC